MNYFAECLARFRLLAADVKDAFGSLETFAAVKELEDRYKVKLSFLVILIAINELEEEDIEEYLSIKFKVEASLATKIKEDLVRQVLDPVYEKMMASEDEEEPEVAKKVSKDDIINLFTKRLVESLKAPAEIIQGINVAIFENFNSDEDLEEKVITILYNNDERLTTNQIMLEDRPVAPTISNWIKDFIKLNGSEMFNDLVLAEYLSTSANAKKLNSEEKNLLRRVLKLYNNLSFFPESMDNQPISQWQLIPFDKSTTKPGEIRDVLSDEEPSRKTPAAKIPAVKSKTTKTAKPVENVVPSKAMSPLQELQSELAKYTPGSLEYKALSQEIGRLKKKK